MLALVEICFALAIVATVIMLGGVFMNLVEYKKTKRNMYRSYHFLGDRELEKEVGKEIVEREKEILVGMSKCFLFCGALAGFLFWLKCLL